MVIMDDFDKFEAEKDKRITEFATALLEAIAPRKLNPGKEYAYVGAEVLYEIAGTAEGVLADNGFSTCIPCRDEETGIPCYLSICRCEHCHYMTPDGRTRIDQGGSNEPFDNQPSN